jgi:hypothetical protein
MIPAIKPNVISQQRLPISKSVLSFILCAGMVGGAFYLHEMQAP